MIILPSTGIPKSVTKHNCRLNVLCDWIETSVMLHDEELSMANVIDTLLEEERYEDSNFASEIVEDAWCEVTRRASLCDGSCGLEIDGNWIRRIGKWETKAEHIFCLLLSLAPQYDWWYKQFGSDYAVQGELFELLTESSLRTFAPDWHVYLTGWSRTNTAGYHDLLKSIAGIIHGDITDLESRTTGYENDMGLDMLYYRPFPDKRAGFPYFMIQCASGKNWGNKVNEPDLAVWSDTVRPPTPPMRGFAVPFCYSDKLFRNTCVRVTGLLLDRCRLLGAGGINQNWLPQPVADGIVDWAGPRVQELLKRSQ